MRSGDVDLEAADRRAARVAGLVLLVDAQAVRALGQVRPWRIAGEAAVGQARRGEVADGGAGRGRAAPDADADGLLVRRDGVAVGVDGLATGAGDGRRAVTERGRTGGAVRRGGRERRAE